MSREMWEDEEDGNEDTITIKQDYEDEKDPHKLHLCDLNLKCRSRLQNGDTKQSDYKLNCYRAALGKTDDIIYLIDVIGPSQTIKALSAALHKSTSADFEFMGCHEISKYRAPKKDTVNGYRTEQIALGQPGSQMQHFIAVSNAPGFMPYVTPLALARSLATDAFATPFLSPDLHGVGVPDWVPWIKKQLIKENCLVRMDCHNCDAGMVLPRPDQIEKIISYGVSSGALPWVHYEMDEIIQACSERKPVPRG